MAKYLSQLKSQSIQTLQKALCYRKRQRPQVKLTAAEVDARASLQKEWTNYKREEYMAHVAQIDRIMAAQKRALDQLYEVSEDLYNEAIMVRF